jgi:Rod binding domain-containing protein
MSVGRVVPAPPPPAMTDAGKDTPDKIRAAATQFEALLIAQMLRSSQSDEGDGTAEGANGSSSSLIELGQQQFAQALASNGGLGIAKIVVAGLESHANR